MANKKKLTTAVVAGATALVLVLGGTFAWTSISQQARNEAIVDINPGGRLHDDFNGTNKDVYVENFSDGATGVPIYARIRLDQYMEIGQEAGLKETDDKKATPIISEDGIDTPSEWETYIPGEESVINPDDPFFKYWSWDLGNGADDMPYYMPTFNKNKDSLAADINGTYEGTVEGDIVHYDNYKEYTADDSITADATYDWDDDTQEETTPSERVNETDPWNSADIYKEEETHTAKQISSEATVILMSDWLAMDDTARADLKAWVYDVDGWAYWSQAIHPGETTGLLLSGINQIRIPDDNWYYGINVVGQFVTSSDLSAFKNDKSGITDNALELLGKASGLGTEFEISGQDTVLPGEEYTYTTLVKKAGVVLDEQPAIEWTATNPEGDVIDGVSITDGVLKIDSSVPTGTEIVIGAILEDGTTANLTVSIPGLMLTYNGDTYVSGDSFDLYVGTSNLTSDGFANKFTFVANSVSDVTFTAVFNTHESDTSSNTLTSDGNTATLNIDRLSLVSSVDLALVNEAGDSATYHIPVYHELLSTIRGLSTSNMPIIIGQEYPAFKLNAAGSSVNADSWSIVKEDGSVSISTQRQSSGFDYLVWTNDITAGIYDCTAIYKEATYIGSVRLVDSVTITLTNIDDATQVNTVKSSAAYTNVYLSPGTDWKLEWTGEVINSWEVSLGMYSDYLSLEQKDDGWILHISETGTKTTGTVIGYDNANDQVASFTVYIKEPDDGNS